MGVAGYTEVHPCNGNTTRSGQGSGEKHENNPMHSNNERWRAIELLQGQHSTLMSACTCKRVATDAQALRHILLGPTIYNDEAVILRLTRRMADMIAVPQTTLGAMRCTTGSTSQPRPRPMTLPFRRR
jgi:hypothetical protein